MPYITEAGARPWSDVINETGDRVRGAFQDVRQHNDRVAEGNRAVHPTSQKWLQKMLSEGMDPAEAAAQAHAEIDANNNGIPDRMEGIKNLGGPAVGGNMTEPGTPSWAPDAEERTVSVDVPQGFDSKPQGLAAMSRAPAAPKPSYASGWNPGASQPQAFTNRDMPVVNKILDYKAASRPRGLSYEERGLLEDRKSSNTQTRDDNKASNTLVRDEQRANVFASAAEKKAAGLKLSQDEDRAQRWREAMLRHKAALAAIQARVEASKGDRAAIAAANNETKILVAKIAAEGRFGSSINSLAGDENTKKMSDQFFDDIMGHGKAVLDATSPGPNTGKPQTSGQPPPSKPARVKAKSNKALAMENGKPVWAWSDDGKIRKPKYADGSYGPEEAVPMGVTK